MSKLFWAAIAVIVIVFGGILLFKGSNQANTSSSNAQPTNHVTGAGTTGVKLVEYGDYQCPFCGEYYPIVKQVVSKYGDQITFQFRNLPLVSRHANALAAARAAEAAGDQNHYWEMHDILYENQDQNGQTGWVASGNPLNDYFVGYAKQIGLDVTKFKTDFAASKTNDVINADIAAFQKLGIDESTPTFILDGKHITPKSVDEFSKLIDAEIKAKAPKA